MRTWRVAMGDALYGGDGFYRREAPCAHFRTSVAVPGFAIAVRRLAGLVDDALGHPDPFDLVDVGAGRGELLSGLPDVPARWRLTGVEVRDDPGVGARWTSVVPPLTGLLFANEWLDNVPLDVLCDGRLVEVGADGTERLGATAPADALKWASRWWPAPGRVEVGLTRDRAWAGAVAQVRRGLAVAVDYGHVRADRRATLTGYRAGRQVAPVPDGSCDLTAHVALDSCAAATGAGLLTQRAALRSLGMSAAVPAPGDGVTAYVAGLQRASDAGELLDPSGLGGFGWLVQPVGIESPL